MDSATRFTIDESQIKSILKQERYYRDTCQWKMMRGTYHPDPSRTLVNISWYEGDIDGFISGSEKHTHNKLNTVHQIDTAEVQINGCKATSESFCIITSRFEHAGQEFDKITQCRLMSQLEKLDDASEGPPWRMLTLEPIYLRDSFVPATPQSTDTFPIFEGLEKYPKTYRHGVWLLESLGITSRYDLPNEDDQRSVDRIIQKNRAWLQAA